MIIPLEMTNLFYLQVREPVLNFFLLQWKKNTHFIAILWAVRGKKVMFTSHILRYVLADCKDSLYTVWVL